MAKLFDDADGSERWVQKFPWELESLATIDDFLRSFVKTEDLSEELRNNLSLVVEEIFVNFVKHNRTQGGVFEVCCIHEQARIRVKITASGVSDFDPTRAPEVDVNMPLEQRRSGGMGIHLVRALTEDLCYNFVDGIAVITFKVRSESKDV